MKYAPIISLHYKRPQHSLRVLESLARNAEAQHSELFIFSDGPKTAADEAGVQAVRKVIRSRQWCGKVNIIEREENLGCFESANSAIAEVCRLEDRFIYTEDDTLLSPHFLNYMNTALNKYEEQPAVMNISGYMWPVKYSLPDTFFLKIPHIWTFASWRRSWKHYSEIDAVQLWSEIRQQNLENDFTFNGTRPWLELLQEEASGKKNCWSIYWAAMVYLNGFSLFPGQSLVSNIGLDGSGQNFNFATSAYDVRLATSRVKDFANKVAEDLDVKLALSEYFRSIMPRRASLVDRSTYRVQKTLRKAFKRTVRQYFSHSKRSR
jgi:hypothetical protein